MKFFAKQKVDQIGITAVTLQKILLFLMILSLFTMFNGGFFSFLLCLIGFIGAYKRSTGMLTAYVSISVVIIVLCSVVAISSIFMVTSDNYVYENSSGSVDGAASSSQTADFGGNMHKLQRLLSRKLSAIGSESDSVTAESSDSVVSSPPNTNWGNDSYSYSESEDNATFGLIFLLIVVMIFAFFLAYLKVYSVVLAWRLRKMILTTATALPTTDVAPQTHEFAPTNTSCAVPETEAPVAPFQHAPLFAPGFAPYPYGMPMMVPPQMQGQGQFPHHVMFGQQPVFYTYAPVPQTPQSEEKM